MVDAVTLVGRDDALATVVRWLSGGGSGLVEGPTGIGKTAVVEAAVRASGVPVLVLRALRHMGEVPLLPIRLALPGIDREATVDDVRAELARHLGERPIVVDDLQYCDPDTLSVLTELAMRVPVVATNQRSGGRWDEARNAVSTAGDVLALEPLPDDVARAFVRALRPGAPDADVERWVGLGGGVPYQLRLLSLGGSDAIVDDATAVAAMPDRLRLGLAEVAAGAPLLLASPLVDELLAVGLVRLDADGRAWPRQDRFGAAALAALDPQTRVELHRRLARAADDPAVRAVHLAAAGDHAAAAMAAHEAQSHAPSRWSYASFRMLEATHTEPADSRMSIDAAEALSLVGRYEDALACLPTATVTGDLDVRAALVTARSAWALTDIPPARAAVERVLARPDAPAAARSEMLTIRSRILARTDWDIDGAIRDGTDALALAGSDPRLQAAAYSALGLARLVVADPGWSADLETAARLAVDDVDVHEAVTIHDAAIFGHLLNGDPARSLALAQEMVAFTEPMSAAWNGYFRAVALLVTMHVTGDQAGVRAEAEVLGRRRLSVRAGETRRTALILARLDGGDELGALDLAESACELASDDTARAMACWMLAESAWLLGDAERALAVAQEALDLPLTGYPASVNGALIGIWAARDLGRAVPAALADATTSGFANLAAARTEAEALTGADPAENAARFGACADAWWRISRRASLRARWARTVALADAGCDDDARRELEDLRVTAAAARIPWLDRRIDALARRLGLRVRSAATGTVVMARVMRGHPTPVIARGLCLGRSTVEGHVRDAIDRTGARTRLEAALALAAAGRDRAAPNSYVLRDDGGGAWSVRSPGLDVPTRRSELPGMPLHFHGEVALVGEVGDGPGVERALLAAARGAALDLRVTDSSALTALADGLSRFGSVVRDDAPVVRGPSGVDVDAVDRRLIAALASGSTVTEAAAAAGYSRRQAQRRLAELRARTGSATNAEAVAALTQDVPD